MEKKWKLGYKVVRKYGKHYASCSLNDRGYKIYKIGKVTKPNDDCGPLAVFGTRIAAVAFGFLDYTLCRCKYIPSSRCGLWIGQHDVWPAGYIPKGTRFADEVELIEEVTR